MERIIYEVAQGIREKVLKKSTTIENVDIEKVAQINELNIVKACIEQPSLYAYWASLHRIAQDCTRRAEYQMEKVEAQLDTEFRAKFPNPAVKVTERAIETEIKNNDKYKSAYEEYLKAKESESILDGFVKALDHRKDMLTVVTAIIRREMDAEIKTKESVITDHFKGE